MKNDTPRKNSPASDFPLEEKDLKLIARRAILITLATLTAGTLFAFALVRIMRPSHERPATQEELVLKR